MIGIYIVFGMAVVGAVLLIPFYHQQKLKMTSSTSGKIISAEQREVRDENERRDETVIVCQFFVNAREHRITHVARGRLAARYPVGQVIEVRYNPSDPQMSRLVI